MNESSMTITRRVVTLEGFCCSRGFCW